MIRWIAMIEPLLFLIGGLLGMWVGIKGIWIAYSEKEPTEFVVDQLVDRHGGQQWLSIQGRVPLEMVFTRFSKANTNVPHGTFKVWIPVVPANWQPADPVHVFVCKVCFADYEAKSWAARFQNDPAKIHSFSGMLRPFGGPRDYQEMFPKLTIEKPHFFINEGNEPDNPIGMYFITGICFLLVAVACYRASRILRSSSSN